MELALAQPTDRIDLVLFISGLLTPWFLYMMSLAPLCALELEGVRGLASGSVRIQLQSRFVKALSFYMTLLLCERGVWR